MTNKIIQYGSRKIKFEIHYSERKTLGITVTPELAVIVKAPIGTSFDKISEIVRKRAGWIFKQEEFFLAYYPKQPPKKFVSGETHLYLGKQYRLKVKQGKKESVRLTGRYFEVICRNKGNVKRLMNNWYLDRASEKYNLYLFNWLGFFKKYKVYPKVLIIRHMSKRWGSCTLKGNILLNPQLIKAPRGCIEYVIVHELCHFVHRNHTQKFFDLQSQIMPEWEKWKIRLEHLLA